MTTLRLLPPPAESIEPEHPLVGEGMQELRRCYWLAQRLVDELEAANVPGLRKQALQLRRGVFEAMSAATWLATDR